MVTTTPAPMLMYGKVSQENSVELTAAPLFQPSALLLPFPSPVCQHLALPALRVTPVLRFLQHTQLPGKFPWRQFVIWNAKLIAVYTHLPFLVAALKPHNLSGKLRRDSLRYRKAVELADALGYDIIWQRRREVR